MRRVIYRSLYDVSEWMLDIIGKNMLMTYVVASIILFVICCILLKPDTFGDWMLMIPLALVGSYPAIIGCWCLTALLVTGLGYIFEHPLDAFYKLLAFFFAVAVVSMICFFISKLLLMGD